MVEYKLYFLPGDITKLDGGKWKCIHRIKIDYYNSNLKLKMLIFSNTGNK